MAVYVQPPLVVVSDTLYVAFAGKVCMGGFGPGNVVPSPKFQSQLNAPIDLSVKVYCSLLLQFGW